MRCFVFIWPISLVSYLFIFSLFPPSSFSLIIIFFFFFKVTMFFLHTLNIWLVLGKRRNWFGNLVDFCTGANKEKDSWGGDKGVGIRDGYFWFSRFQKKADANSQI